MKIIHLSYNGYPSPHPIGGGDVRRWQEISSLRKLGHEVHVFVCNPQGEEPPQLRALASSIQTFNPNPHPTNVGLRLIQRFANPETFALRFPDARDLRTRVTQAIDRSQPDLIWAVEAFAAQLTPQGYPLVHSHLDFMHKLRPIRRSITGWKPRRPDALSMTALRQLEFDVCKRSTHNVCASSSEAAMIRQAGANATYIPIADTTTPRPTFDDVGDARFFVFGNPNTAMRSARLHLRDSIWPEVQARDLKLSWHQLGKPPRRNADPSWGWLQKHFKIHGYVDDLASILRTGDASVMPYPYDTGGRAKYAVSAGYGVVNIAYKTTFDCAKEFVHGESCLAAESPADFVDLLDRYSRDAAWRRKLSIGSRHVYEKHHTQENQLPLFEKVLNSIGKQVPRNPETTELLNAS